MRIRSKRTDIPENFSIWTSFTDLMSNAFMVLTLLLLLVIASIKIISEENETTKGRALEYQTDAEQANKRALEYQTDAEQANKRALAARQEVDRLQRSLDEQAQQAQAARQKVDRLQRSLQEMKRGQVPPPPIFVIEETGKYQFRSGSAELPYALQSYIRKTLVARLEENARKYDIDVIEVIGHTDGQPISDGSTNLDSELERVARGDRGLIRNLDPASNADLGLMRALAVVKELQEIQRTQNRLRGLRFRPYSAAQLLLPNGSFARWEYRNPDGSRRRIEIRFTRLGAQQTIR